jgi:hypothetical protein
VLLSVVETDCAKRHSFFGGAEPVACDVGISHFGGANCEVVSWPCHSPILIHNVMDHIISNTPFISFIYDFNVYIMFQWPLVFAKVIL